MKAKVSLKMFVLSAALLVVSLATSARSYDNQLIYNPIEENGMTVGQTVYKMDGNTLANYMKYNYKYEMCIRDSTHTYRESGSLCAGSKKSSSFLADYIKIDFLGKTVITYI